MTLPPFEPGRIVGERYTVRRLLSRGAWSALYEAITAPNREVLLEVFAPETVGPPDLHARLERVLSEVNALPASIVLPVIDAAVDRESGCPFIASEASMTPSLAELVKLCPLAGDELVAFVARLCAALDGLHSRPSLYADLHPSKVFVGRAPRFDVRLGGVGTWLLTGRASDPAWAAPEAAASPSAASDVYAAALSAIYAASGARPDDPAAFVAALRRGADADAKDSVDARLAEPLSRALAAAPAERPNSARAFAESVTEAMGSSFVVSSPWLAAAPASTREVAAVPVLPVPAPQPGTSVDAVTTPLSSPADAFPPPRAVTSRGRRLGIIAAAIGAVAIGAFAIALVVFRAQRHGGDRGSIAVASAAPATSVATAPPAPPAPEPEPEPIPSPAPSATAEPPKPQADLLVTCIPECDSITVDGKRIEGFPATFKPGGHNIVARRGYHPPQYRFVLLSAGRETKVSFIWRKPPAPKKP